MVSDAAGHRARRKKSSKQSRVDVTQEHQILEEHPAPALAPKRPREDKAAPSCFFIDTAGEVAAAPNGTKKRRRLNIEEAGVQLPKETTQPPVPQSSQTRRVTVGSTPATADTPMQGEKADPEQGECLPSLSKYLVQQQVSSASERQQQRKDWDLRGRYFFGKNRSESLVAAVKVSQAGDNGAGATSSNRSAAASGPATAVFGTSSSSAICTDDGYLTKYGARQSCVVCCNQGHKAWECSEVRCLTCFDKGHNAKTCPRMGQKCARCGRRGHEEKGCIVATLLDGSRCNSWANVRCANCGELGHPMCGDEGEVAAFRGEDAIEADAGASSTVDGAVRRQSSVGAAARLSTALLGRSAASSKDSWWELNGRSQHDGQDGRTRSESYWTASNWKSSSWSSTPQGGDWSQGSTSNGNAQRGRGSAAGSGRGRGSGCGYSQGHSSAAASSIRVAANELGKNWKTAVEGRGQGRGRGRGRGHGDCSGDEDNMKHSQVDLRAELRAKLARQGGRNGKHVGDGEVELPLLRSLRQRRGR